MSKLSPQQTRDALLAGGNVRPGTFSSAPLHKSPPQDSKALAIAARRAAYVTQEEAQKRLQEVVLQHGLTRTAPRYTAARVLLKKQGAQK